MAYDVDNDYPGVATGVDEDEAERLRRISGGMPGVNSPDLYSGADSGPNMPPLNARPMPTAPDIPGVSGPMLGSTELSSPEMSGNVGAPPSDRGPSYHAAMESTVGRRPQITDPEYQPAELHGWKRGLGALFTGMAAMSPNDPQAGARVSHELFEAPRERAQKKFETASHEFEQRVADTEREATGERAERTANSEANLRAAQAKQFDMVPIAIPGQTEPVYVPRKDEARVIQGLQANQTKKDVGAAANTSRETIATGRNDTAETVAGMRIKSADQIALDNRLSRERIARGHDLNAQEVAKIRAASANDPNKLTNTMKTMKQQAQSTLPEIEKALDETQRVSELLGPGEGRWNDFWQGKIGADDPEFAHYKDEIAFISTAVTLAHARGRMSNELFEHFQQMFNVGRQSAGNMTQALTVAQEWLDGYAKLGDDKTPAAKDVAEKLPAYLPDIKTGGRNGQPIPDGVYWKEGGKRVFVVKDQQWHTVTTDKTKNR